LDITSPRPGGGQPHDDGQQPTAEPALLDRYLSLARVNWEVVYFVALLVVVVLTRLLALDNRAPHHDEGIHAVYSYGAFTGHAPYTYDPVYHGPFLYLMTQIAFLFFGASDYTMRLAPAIFGIILVLLVWQFRIFIGKWGALAAATLVTFSPSISYYSRSLRHDIFATVATAVLILAIFNFIRTHQSRYIYWAAIGAAVGISSHEMMWLNGFIFVSFFAFAAIFEMVYNSRKPVEQRPLLLAGQALLRQPRMIAGAVITFVTLIVLFFSNLLTNFDSLGKFFSGLTYWNGQQVEARGGQPWYYYFMLLFIYEILPLTFGIAGGVYLLIRQLRHQVEPDDSYPNLTDPDVATGPNLPTPRSVIELVLPALGYWSLSALIVYTLAGEKMPWLTMQIALPLCLMAGMAIGRLLKGMDWRGFFNAGGLWLGLVFIALAFAFIAFGDALRVVVPVDASGTVTDQAAQAAKLWRSLLTAAFIVALVALILSFSSRLGLKQSVLAFSYALCGVLLVYTVHSTINLNFYNTATPVEMLIYTQSSPSTGQVAGQISRLSRDVTAFTKRGPDDPLGGRSLDIAIDNSVEWPFDWYFRDQRGLSYFNERSPLARNTSVILSRVETNGADVAGDKMVADLKTRLGTEYVVRRYPLRWWFPEELYRDANYKPRDLGSVAGELFKGENLPKFAKYFFYRDPQFQLGSTDFYLFVKNDYAQMIGFVPEGTVASSPVTSDTGGVKPPTGKTYGMLDLEAEGSDNGAFSQPRQIALAPDGTYYVLDTNNGRVEHFTADYKYIGQFGKKGTASGEPKDADPGTADGDTLGVLANGGGGPNGMAVDKDGNIYIADTWFHRVQKFDKDGKFVLSFGGFAATGGKTSDNNNAPGKFWGPRGVATDAQGSVYVTDTGNKRVQIFDGTGKFLRTIGGVETIDEPIGVAVDQAGNVYVGSTRTQSIVKFDAAGNKQAAWRLPDNGWQPGAYMEPQIALDAAGNIYTTDPSNAQVVKFRPDGTVASKKAKEAGVSLKTPTGIVLDKAGNIYVVDTTQQGVIRFTAMQ